MIDISKEKESEIPQEDPSSIFEEISSDDITKFHNDVIMGDGSFKKTYKIGRTLTVTYRTRMGDERNIVQERLAIDPKTGLDMIRLNGDYNLAFSLVDFCGKNYDSGTFEERLKRLYSMPAPKLNLLWDHQTKFDEYVNKLISSEVNF